MRPTLKAIIVLATLFVVQPFRAEAQKLKPFAIFDRKGKAGDWTKMAKDAKAANLTCFGELHDNSLCHWLELQLLVSLAKENKLEVGMEMFSTEDSLILSEYVTGQTSSFYFEKGANLWNNYKTDYKPLVEYCKKKNVPVLGTNVPRRYAGMVSKKSVSVLDSLPSRAGVFLPPLPLKIDYRQRSYVEMAEMMGKHGGRKTADNMVAAQALKDASMAYVCSLAMSRGSKVLHFHGAYHSLYKEGIVSFFKQYAPKLNTLVITCVEQDQVSTLNSENEDKGDYIIVLPKTMTKTY